MLWSCDSMAAGKHLLARLSTTTLAMSWVWMEDLQGHQDVRSGAGRLCHRDTQEGAKLDHWFLNAVLSFVHVSQGSECTVLTPAWKSRTSIVGDCVSQLCGPKGWERTKESTGEVLCRCFIPS